MNNKALLLFFLVLLIGCASQYTQKTQQKKRTEELVSRMLEEKIKKTLVNILCDQTSYLLCFDISREQCIGELTEYNSECYNEAKEKVSGPLTIEKNAENFVTIVFMCMMFKHIAVHAENAQEIGECFDKASFDKATAVRSIHKSIVKGLKRYKEFELYHFRAFAINPSTGRWGRSWWSRTPKQAMDVAMNRCQRTGEECMLYALEDTIVFGMSESELMAVAKKHYIAIRPDIAFLIIDKLIGERLSSEQITEILSERNVLGRNFNEMEYKGIWRSDGTMKAVATSLNDIERIQKDEGTWTVENGKLCRQWQRWSGGRHECLLVTQDENILRGYDEHGDVIEFINLLNQK